MNKTKHVAIRLYLYFLLFLFCITGGLSMFVLAPVYKHAFAPLSSYRDFKIIRVWLHVFKIMWRSISNKTYRSLYPFKMTDPPKIGHDKNNMRIKESWLGAEDNCDLCQESCCMQIQCPMMDEKRRCLCYGSWYFGYFFCGRYPESQSLIDLYQCPKWEMYSMAESGYQ